MRIVVLGGLGFIGSHVAAAIKRRGHSVGIMDCYNQYNWIPDAEYFDILDQRRAHAPADRVFEGRIEDEIRLDEVFSEYKPQVVVHLATYPHAKMVERDAADAANNMLGGTEKVLAACARHKVSRLVFASSSMVYGDFGSDVPDEESRTHPLTQYGQFKLEGEHLCRRVGKRSGLEVVILRPSAVYGLRDIIARVISLMARNCVHHGRIVVQGKDSRLDFSFVEEVAEAFALAAVHPAAAGQTFNCTRGRGRTLLEAAEILRASVGHGLIDLREVDAFYPSRGTLNSDKIKTELGWAPIIDIETGIPAYVRWFLEQGYVKQGAPSTHSPSFAAGRSPQVR